MDTQVLGTPRLADDIDPSPPDRRNAFTTALFFAGKLIVSAACFWYALRQINMSEAVRTLPTFDFHWAAFAVAVAMAQGGWRAALTSVMIDRAVGVAVLIAFAFVILLLPSALTALSGYRDLMLFVFGAALVFGALALFSTPRLAPLLQRWRYSYWIGTFAADAHRVLLGPRAPIIFGAAALIHVLTILVIWLVGRAQGLALPVFDCAVLFTVMVGVALAPISVGGWGLRELAVVSLLGAHGLAPERALIFSVCFGLVAVIGVLPGLVVWLLYPLPRLAVGMAGRRR